MSTDVAATAPSRDRILHLLGRILRFPVTRIIVAFLLIGAAANLARFVLTRLHAAVGLGQLRETSLLYAVPVVLAVHFTYLAYVRWVERRKADELAYEGALKEIGLGILTGALLLSATVGAIAALGDYTVTAMNPWRNLVPPLAMALASAYVEELLFRGLLFRVVEEGLGTWIALLISSAFFGLVHIANPNATLLSGVAIFLEAGILLGGAYVLTRRLWLAIGIHFAWNFTQGGIFGINVSGVSVGGLLESHLSGSPFLSGGALGAEASVFAVAFCLAVAVAFLVVAFRRGRFVSPFWRRSKS